MKKKKDSIDSSFSHVGFFKGEILLDQFYFIAGSHGKIDQTTHHLLQFQLFKVKMQIKERSTCRNGDKLTELYEHDVECNYSNLD